MPIVLPGRYVYTLSRGNSAEERFDPSHSATQGMMVKKFPALRGRGLSSQDAGRNRAPGLSTDLVFISRYCSFTARLIKKCSVLLTGDRCCSSYWDSRYEQGGQCPGPQVVSTLEAKWHLKKITKTQLTDRVYEKNNTGKAHAWEPRHGDPPRRHRSYRVMWK